MVQAVANHKETLAFCTGVDQAAFKNGVKDKMDLHKTFLNDFLRGIAIVTPHVPPRRRSHLPMLDRGVETSQAFKQLIAEYLGVPVGKELTLLRTAWDNLESLGSSASASDSSASNHGGHPAEWGAAPNWTLRRMWGRHRRQQRPQRRPGRDRGVADAMEPPMPPADARMAVRADGPARGGAARFFFFGGARRPGENPEADDFDLDGRRRDHHREVEILDPRDNEPNVGMEEDPEGPDRFLDFLEEEIDDDGLDVEFML